MQVAVNQLDSQAVKMGQLRGATDQAPHFVTLPEKRLDDLSARRLDDVERAASAFNVPAVPGVPAAPAVPPAVKGQRRTRGAAWRN